MSANHKSPCVITIGNFDGVHKGHSALINTAILFAHNREYRKQFLDAHEKLARCYASFSNSSGNLQASTDDMEARIITFSPHPAYVLNSKPFTPLMSDATRLWSLQTLGADHINIIPFNQSFAKQTCEDFCIKMVQDYNMKMLFVGHDFTMGYDRGDIKTLEEIGMRYGFCVHALHAITTSNTQNSTLNTQNSTLNAQLIISSTHIRKALENGNIELANHMLGKPFSINGIVEHGAKRGGDLLGFPTANIKEEATVTPKNGVYATLCKILTPKYEGRVFLGVTNIGHKPTFGEFAKSIETYILDFKDDLYDLSMEISFIRFLRDEMKFNSAEELIKQIQEDTKLARKILESL